MLKILFINRLFIPNNKYIIYKKSKKSIYLPWFLWLGELYKKNVKNQVFYIFLAISQSLKNGSIIAITIVHTKLQTIIIINGSSMVARFQIYLFSSVV